MSRQYPGSRGQLGNGIATATTARARAKGIAIRAPVADCFYGPNESPHFIAEPDRAATPYVATVEPRKNCPLPPADMAGVVSLYGLRGRTERDDEPVKHELGWANYQVRSGQAIQREPPVVSDPPSSDHDRPADTRSRPVRRRGSRQLCSPELASLAVVLAKASGSAAGCQPNQQSGSPPPCDLLPRPEALGIGTGWGAGSTERLALNVSGVLPPTLKSIPLYFNQFPESGLPTTVPVLPLILVVPVWRVDVAASIPSLTEFQPAVQL
ncbi:hypothetical protein GCM10010211_55670 [Streptomyces albospinus]|uniref:Uncharacterized protein n=1 Tax=Streptomyces albospinus TaxID=285515 RepID=A0ABQ2VG11_9ACTN|nr:hypothetical protein [Streptomyces albospinus]GGU82533.1 hypothetical protein GCM10010211_55670 [Streptomyces albospinus]